MRFTMTRYRPSMILLLLCMWQATTAFAFCPTTRIGTPVSTTTAPTTATTRSIQRSRPLQAAISAHKVQTAIASNNAMRGKLMIIVSKFLVSPAVYVDVARRLLRQTYLPEVLLIGALIQSMPFVKWIYRMRHSELIKNDNDADADKNDAFREAFEASRSYKLARVIQQVGFLQAILYASDVCLVALKFLDFKFVVKYQAQSVAGSIITTSWFAWNASRLKHYYLSARTFSWRGQNKPVVDANGVVAQNRFLNRLSDGLIYGCAGLTVIDLLGVEVGFALKSIFGLGSFGTLALSLASKDLAAEFVGGLMIQTSNFFDEGEVVVLQDGTKGSVAKIGWLVSVRECSLSCVRAGWRGTKLCRVFVWTEYSNLLTSIVVSLVYHVAAYVYLQRGRQRHCMSSQFADIASAHFEKTQSIQPTRKPQVLDSLHNTHGSFLLLSKSTSQLLVNSFVTRDSR